MVNTSIDGQGALERQQLLNQKHRKRLARKIHDDISQKMTLLSLQLSLAATEEGPPENWSATCQEWSDIVTDLGQAVREVLSELQPRIVDEFGLATALRSYAQSLTKKIPCTVVAPREPVSVPPAVAEELFGICRDIVSDVLVPGKAPALEIQLEEREGAVCLCLRAGKFITESALETVSARERAQCLDGSVELNSSADVSVLTLSVPANHPEPCGVA